VKDFSWYETMMRVNYFGSLWCSRYALPVEECARLIAEAMAKRRRELIMTAKGKLGQWVKLIAPSLVDRIALAALKKDARVN
jgi:hypothetical protein